MKSRVEASPWSPILRGTKVKTDKQDELRTDRTDVFNVWAQAKASNISL